MYVLKKITFRHGDIGEEWSSSWVYYSPGCCHPQLLANKDHGLGDTHLVLNLDVAISSVETFQPSMLWTS